MQFPYQSSERHSQSSFPNGIGEFDPGVARLMPAATISEVYSWSVYLLSSALLLGTIAPALNFSSSVAVESETASIVQGIASQINSLQPGLKETLHFATGGIWTGSVELHGHHILGRFGSFLFVSRCNLLLPSVQLFPGRTYEISMSGVSLLVEEAGLS